NCHGKAEGKNGFKLSVFGFDARADHQALTMEARGRRVFPGSPENSLMLRKASGQIVHGGGRRVPQEGPHYHPLRRWIAEGAKFTAGPPSQSGLVTVGAASQAAPNPLPPSPEQVQAIEVEPRQQIMTLRGTQQLRVTAVTFGG